MESISKLRARLSSLLLIAAAVATQAHAVPMRIDVEGYITSDYLFYQAGGIDESNNLVGSKIRVKYLFDTDNAGGDKLSSDPTRNLHQPGTNWIQSSVNLGFDPFGIRIPDNGIVTGADLYNDYLQMWDQHSVGIDRYMVYSASRDTDPLEEYIAYSWVQTTQDDFIESFDLDQEFNWNSDGGYTAGGFIGYSTARPLGGILPEGFLNAGAYYTATSFTVRAVPEPTAASLLLAGLFGVAILRLRSRRKEAASTATN